MIKTYIAASFAYEDREKTEKRKADIDRIAEKLKKVFKSDFYLPHHLTIPNAWGMSLEAWAQKVFEADFENLNHADRVIFISYGKENNSGSVWECGYAFAKDIPVVVIKMTDESESLMITSTATAIIRESDIETYDFLHCPRKRIKLDRLN